MGTKLRRFAQTMIPLKYRQPQPPNKILSEIEAGENMKSHHTKSVKKFLDEQKVSYLYLPPYSPDLNPIEKLWSKVKDILRKLKARASEQLPLAIKAAFDAVAPSDCAGWFRFCNYWE